MNAMMRPTSAETSPTMPSADTPAACISFHTSRRRTWAWPPRSLMNAPDSSLIAASVPTA
jgi:hypothetical protein